jgi:hypothetical protein
VPDYQGSRLPWAWRLAGLADARPYQRLGAHCCCARLAPCEIVAPIGAGGMGEIYKIRETRGAAIRVSRPGFHLRSWFVPDTESENPG